MNHIPRKNLFYVSFLSIYLLTAPVAGQKPASQPASRPAKVKITISRKTTYILGPVNADGTVNYVAAINKMSSKGVTPKNNAAIPLLEALGPEVIDKLVREQTFKILKIPSLPKKGEYFVPFSEYQEHHEPKDGTDEQIDAFYKKTDANWFKAPGAPFSPKDFPFVAAWVKVNEKPLALVAIATARPRHYIPSLSSSKPPCMFDVPIPDFRRYKEVAKALCLRSMLKANSGDIAAARADLMVVHRLARLVGQGPTLVDRLFAMSIEAFACSSGTVLATSGKLTAAQAKAHLADLQALSPLPGVVEAIDKAERFCTLDGLTICARRGLRKAWPIITGRSPAESMPNFNLDWNVPLRRANQYYDRMVSACQKKTFLERRQANETIFDNLMQIKTEATRSKLRTRLFASRYVGDLILSLLMPTLGRASELYDDVVMKRRMAGVALALAACKAEKGKYPEKLAELKPTYLKKIPTDLFIEKPLHYKRTGDGYLLYSVGPDMKDDGGKGKGEDNWKRDDIVVRTR